MTNTTATAAATNPAATTTTATPPKATTFESQTCSRCGGCGEYSYCQTHGRRCFKCGGSGRSLTKRGAIAAKFYSESLEVLATQIQVGDRIWDNGCALGGGCGSSRGFRKVLEISIQKDRSSSRCYREGVWVEDSYDYLCLLTETGTYNYLISHRTGLCTAKVRKDWGAEKANKLAAALEFQASLTKTGTPRKAGKK